MTDEERNKMKAWVDNWKTLGPILEKLQRKELKTLNITNEIMALSDASTAALKMYPPKPTSGMIEMQRLFMKMKK